jgi:CheY-like chemotaxis protein
MSLIRGTFDPAVVVDVHLPPDLLSVETDAAQLESSLLSLALNARDAMPQGGRLTVAAETIDHPGGPGLPPGTYVRIRVSDTGEGMTPDTLARAVEPFFTTKGVGKGTGLGLSMVHGLAAQFGGKLELTSQEGHGTSADLWLPASAPRRAPAPMAPMPDRDPARSLALVILAVDDDPLVLFNTIAMLQDQGHQTLSASSGGEALQLLESARHVDLVISDQAMPNMTGLQLALALRNRRPDLPVILATGYSELPASDGEPLITLNKPFGSVELAQAIADAVCSRAAPD